MSGIKALLLDLDDTLLLNDMETFGPHYFEALLAKVSAVCRPGPFIEALRAGTHAMMVNDGTQGTNAEVFQRTFFPLVGCDPDELMPLFEDFYTHEFHALREHTAVDPDARPLVELAMAQGYQVAIATQPMFPRVAIEARLKWAGVGVDEFAYDAISCYETMSACKPRRHFFRTMLERLGRAPEECLMVGDSQADMAAGRLGIKTFWVQRDRDDSRGMPRAAYNARGSLRDLIRLIETRRIDAL